MNRSKKVAVFCWVAVMATGIAKANIAYTNFGASHSYNAGVGWTVGPNGSGNDNQWGFQFTSSASGIVSAVRVALAGLSSAVGTAAFDLYTDNGSDQIDQFIATYTGNVPTLGNSAVLLLNGSGGQLTTNSVYWLVGRSTNGTSFRWEEGLAGNSGSNAALSDGGGPFSYFSPTPNERYGAFEIEVTPQSVPEPFTMMLMGGAAVAGFRRVRRTLASKHKDMNS